MIHWVCGRVGVHGQLFLPPNARQHGLWNLTGAVLPWLLSLVGGSQNLSLMRLLNHHHLFCYLILGFKLGYGPGAFLHFDSISPKDQVALVNVFREHKIASTQLSASADKVLERNLRLGQCVAIAYPRATSASPGML